jgi:uncharacterized protein (DUF4415 family)
MTNDRPRRPVDTWKNAEAVFKPAPKAPVIIDKQAAIPGAKEMVTLRIDSDVLEHFQSGGPGWQDRMNLILRAAAKLE